MRKLLQLNVTANWGSTGKIAEGIGKTALSHGWQSYIAYGRYMNPSESNLVKVGNKFDVYAHYAKNRFFDGEGFGSRNATLNLIKTVQEIQPDIIHLHNIHDHWLNFPILFKYLKSISTPIVWTFHDCWAFTGGCTYFDESHCEKWKDSCKKCPQKHSLITKTDKHFNLRKNLISTLEKRLSIVSVSSWLKSFCEQSILKDSNINLIHNGIDTNRFNISTSKRTKPTIIGVALPWSSRKGLDDIIKLRQILPKENIDIILVGLSSEQIKRLPDGIIGISRTHNIEELRDLYSSSHVFINPTLSDNFPTVNLEALACGTPVVTYRTGGSPEAIDDNTGLVVDKGDVNGLADAITNVISDSNRFSIDNCRKRAVMNFNADTQFNKYIELYDQLLSK